MTNRLTINGVTVATDSNLVVGISFSIADLKDIQSRKVARSLPIEVLGTGGVNSLFNFIFEISATSGSFNPNKKLPAVYYKNDIPFFIGDIQLLESQVTFVGSAQYVKYSLFMVGKTSDLFTSIATAKLTDIDWSDLNHPFVYDSGYFPTKWTENSPAVLGKFCYPFIDYGASRIPQTSEWVFESLKPAIFELEYINRIFEYAGKTFTSSFLSSDYYKKIIIPSNTEGYLSNTADQLDDYRFEATTSAPFPSSTVPATHLTGQFWKIADIYDAWQQPIPTDTEAGGADPSNSFNTTTYLWSCQNKGLYVFDGQLEFEVEFTVSDPSTRVFGDLQFEVSVYREDNLSGVWTIVGGSFPTYAYFQQLVSNPNNVYSQTFSAQITTTPISCDTNTRMRFVLRQSAGNRISVLDGGSAVSAGTVDTIISVLTGTSFSGYPTSFALEYGQTVDMGLTVPRETFMLDFLSSVIRSENLMIEQDPTDPNNYIIEPRNSFYGTGVSDWTDKFDMAKGMVVKPMAQLDFKRYLLKFSEDNDQYSLDYKSKTGKNYGDYTYEVDNDFIKEDKEVNVIFAPCVMVGSYDIDIVALRFYKQSSDISRVDPIKTKIRRAYWNNSVACQSYTFYINGTPYAGSSYPFAGSVDNPYAPTLDLNFGLPDLLYVVFSGTYTNNNRGNVQYLQMLNEISDKDSKEVTASFWLTENDLYNFTFRKLVYFLGEYYYVNLISEFNPDGSESTKCVLFRLNPSSVFVPETFNTLSSLGNGLDNLGNLDTRGGQSIGDGNINSGAIMIGDNNVMGFDVNVSYSPIP